MVINYVAVLVAAVVAWVAGAVWYGVLSKPWMAAAGLSDSDMKDVSGRPAMPVGPMVVSFVAELLMAYMLAGILLHLGGPYPLRGIIAGALIWTGFVATTNAVNNGFQKRKTMLTVIDGGHWLLVLVLQGAIIGWFG